MISKPVKRAYLAIIKRKWQIRIYKDRSRINFGCLVGRLSDDIWMGVVSRSKNWSK